MKNWVLLNSYDQPIDANMAKIALEAAGYPVQIKDELTVQSLGYYAGVVGGVKLLVLKTDYHKAMEILVDAGNMMMPIKQNSKWVDRFDKFTSSLPLIGDLQIEIRFLVMIGIVLLLTLIPLGLVI